jgi:tungstate transport system substrate-binding protein
VQRFPRRRPEERPGRIKGGQGTPTAFRKIAGTKAPFASHGDGSGTHKAERKLRQEAGVDAKAASGTWYRETGSGMGPTPNTAAGMGAHALTDRGTWLDFKNRGDPEILFEGDRRLFNQHGVTLVNPAKHPHVKAEPGRRFVDWPVGRAGQAAIAGYRIDGRQLFFPNAPAAS